MTKWTAKTAAELAAYYALEARLDPAFAARDKAFWESRTTDQLRTLRHQAWNCNDGDQFSMAETYLALRRLEAAA